MTLDDIPPDVTLVLTKEHNRLFKAAGCNPTCHACLKPIKLGSKFTLVSHKGRDVMICNKKFCDVDKVDRRPAMDRRNFLQRHARYAAQHPGYSRPSLKRRNCYRHGGNRENTWS